MVGSSIGGCASMMRERNKGTMSTKKLVTRVTGTSSPLEGAIVRVIEATDKGFVVELVGFEGTRFTLDGSNIEAIEI
jgi:hypothetical protein